MNDTKIASKAKAQLAHFMGKVFTHFSKPSKKFIDIMGTILFQAVPGLRRGIVL